MCFGDQDWYSFYGPGSESNRDGVLNSSIFSLKFTYEFEVNIM